MFKLIAVLLSTFSVFVLPAFSKCSDPNSPIGVLHNYQRVDSLKTPLILIHGIHGTKQDSSPADHPSVLGSKEYWYDFIERHWKSDQSLKQNYQLFVFKYCSDRKPISDVATVLGNEIDKQLRNKTHVIVAHSMGGLVSKAYMADFVHKSGTWAGKRGGDTTLGLITLATPHRGTPGANDPVTLQPLTPDYLEDLYAAIVKAYWRSSVGEDHPAVDDSKVPNRSDLRWDNYDRKIEGNSTDLNSYLVGLNRRFQTYRDKLIAYAGFLDTKFRPIETAALMIELKESGAKAIDSHRLLTISNIGLVFGLDKNFGNADGMVPFDSGLFCDNKQIMSPPNSAPKNFICISSSRMRRFEPGGNGEEIDRSEYPDPQTQSIYRTRRGFDHLDMFTNEDVLKYVVKDLNSLGAAAEPPISIPPRIEVPPIPTLFLFDVSGSMQHNDKIGQARAAGIDALREMREQGAGSPPISVMSFAGECSPASARRLMAFAPNMTQAENVIRRLTATTDATPLPQAKDAAYIAITNYLNANPGIREGHIILLSDGQSTCGDIRPPEVFSRWDFGVRKVANQPIKYFTVGFDVLPGSAAERDLQYLASQTGGKYYNAADRNQLIRALQKQVRRFVPRPCNSTNPDFAAGLNAFATYDYRSAMEAFKRYTAANPSDYCGHYNLGLAYEAIDRYKEAGESFHQYLNISPNSPDRSKVEARILRLREEYLIQYDYFVNLAASDVAYLENYYQSIFNRPSSDLAREFSGFVYEKGDFYANLPEILEIDERWLVNGSKDLSSSINTLARRMQLESFDRDAVSLLTVPIADLKDLIEQLRRNRP